MTGVATTAAVAANIAIRFIKGLSPALRARAHAIDGLARAA
jgi:hypothetical protein